MTKKILLVTHLHRDDVANAAMRVRELAENLGISILDPDTREIPDLVLGLGGDGTILTSAEFARQWDVPLLGMNFGHMGFLAETSVASVDEMMERVASGDFRVDKRMTLDCRIEMPKGRVRHDWALNEVAILHTDQAHPAEVVFAVDGQAVSTYATDGIIVATPTGSTAYSFSAGGPVVWPDVEAIVMSPLAAHGLFTRPLVVGPDSELVIGILPENRLAPMVWFDGKRRASVPASSQIVVQRSEKPVRLARLDDTPFSSRLVTKFALPTTGWRGTNAGRNTSGATDAN